LSITSNKLQDKQGGQNNGQVDKYGGASTNKGDNRHGHYHFEKKCHLGRLECNGTFHFAWRFVGDNRGARVLHILTIQRIH
jgi:hypothetical protein